MSIARNALGIFTHEKQVLTKMQDRDVSMMGMFGEEIQDAFFIAYFIHQVVHDKEATLRKPFGQLAQLRNSLVKMDATFFHASKPVLPRSVGIMDDIRRRLKQLQIV